MKAVKQASFFVSLKGGHISMNRKEWDQTMPSILAALEPGEHSLREIMLSRLNRGPQAHEGVFLCQDIAMGRYPRISLNSWKNADGACTYTVQS